MRNDTNRQECVAVIGSMTQAMRAQSVLASAAVRAQVIKADSFDAKQGCAYAVSYACVQEENVRRILQAAGLRVRSFYGGGRQ
ncbi:MAG: DUF3343 domain-containing protein [Clostridia bacterium]|nr:DUF3343 domain-containing protein [Clostridia bacterium]